MTTSFRYLYDNPPRGVIQGGHASTTSTAALTHHLDTNLIPNEIVAADNLPTDLVQWAQAYLNNIQHQPASRLVNAIELVSSHFDRAHAGNEGTVTSLYAQAIQGWSVDFVEEADQLPFGTVRFEECPQTTGVRTDWQWRRDNESRIVVEHKGRLVFERFSGRIRSLALANQSTGSRINPGTSGVLANEEAIIANVCQTTSFLQRVC